MNFFARISHKQFLGLVISILLILPLVHLPFQSVNAAQLFWNAELDTKKTFDGLQSIVIDEGRLEYFNDCFSNFFDFRGDKVVNDWIYTQSDIYIVPHRDFWASSTELRPNALMDAGKSPTFVISFPFIPTFSDLLIGSTNRIGNGEFDVVYDECQDGFYNGEDTVFGKAVTIDIPKSFSFSRTAKSFIEQDKHSQAMIARNLEGIAEAIPVIWKVAKFIALAFFFGAPGAFFAQPLGEAKAFTMTIVDIWIDKLNSNFQKLSLPIYIPTGVADTGVDILVTILEKIAARYRSLAADPPDFNYRTPTELGDRTFELDMNLEDPLLKVLLNMGKEMNNEVVISNSLLTSFERYQGAEIDGNLQWGLIHANELKDYSEILAKQIEKTQNAISDVIDVVSSENYTDLAADKLKETQDIVRTSGFNESRITELKNMNLTAIEIQDIYETFNSVDFSLHKSQVKSELSSLLSNYDDLEAGLNNFSVAIDDTINIIRNDSLSRFIIDIPNAKPGLGYFGSIGTPIQFNGTESDSPESNITRYEWDLDGDGKFDDSLSSLPQYTYSRPFHGYVGLKVTNERGFTDADYAEITVTDNNRSPSIVNATPQPTIINMEINSSRVFTVQVSDPDGVTPFVDWLVDGNVSATGTSFVYKPEVRDFGLHLLAARVTDAETGISTQEQWKLLVLFPDKDDDKWRSNTDCDDNNANINPGMRELFYNGLDDDCNPASIDSNSPPVANNQTVQVSQFSSSDIILTGNDIDGYPLNFTISSQPKNGTLGNVTVIDSSNARVSYKPHGNFHGEDSFTFAANDGNYTSSPAFVNITVIIQDSPVAHDQQVVMDEDTSKEIILNSASPDGHQLIFSLPSKPQSGKLSNLTQTNSTSAKVTYSPYPDYNSNFPYPGNDSFSFKVNDGFDPFARGESSATVQIAINAINDPPQSLGNFIETQEDIAVNVSLRGSDVENDPLLQDGYNHNLTFSITDPPQHGTLSEIKSTQTGSNSDLRINSTDDRVIYSPAPGFIGEDHFEFSTSDGDQTGEPSNVRILVTELNSSLPTEFEKGDLFIIDGAQAQWRDANGSLNRVLKPITAGIIQKDGAFDSSGNLYMSEYNGGIVSKFNKTGHLLGPFGDYFKDYECVPHPNDGSPVCEFWPFSITFDKKGFAYIAGQSSPSSTNDGMDDIRKFDPNGNLVQKFDADIDRVEQGIQWVELSPDQCTLYYTTLSDSIKRFDVCKDRQLSDYVNIFNDPSYDRQFYDHQPVLVNRLLSNGEMLIAHNAIMEHLDTNGKIKRTYDLSGTGDWISLAINPDERSYWAGATNGKMYKFDINNGKILQFFDSGYCPDPLTPCIAFPSPLGLLIKGEPQPGVTNIAPSVDNQTVTTNKNQPVAINLTGSDISNDSLTFSVISEPSFGTLGQITKISSNTAKVVYTPNQNSDSLDSMTYIANDGLANSSNIGKIMIVINHSPTALDDFADTVESKTTNIPVLANDTDADGNKVDIVSVNTSSLIGDIIVNGQNGTLTYRPLPNFTGQETFHYTVTDGVGANDTANVIVNVKSLNDPPVANNQTVTITEDTTVNITLSASDTNNDTLIFSKTGGPANGFVTKFNITSGSLQYSPLPNFHGQDSFTFRVSDGKTRSSPAVITINVTDDGSNDPPKAVSERTSTKKNQPIVIDVLSNDYDPNGDSLTITNITGPINGSAHVNLNNTITYTPPHNYNGSDVFAYNITDGKGGTDFGGVIVDVQSTVSNLPTVQDQFVSTKKNIPLNITLTGISPSGSPIIFSIIDDVAHGNLSGISTINDTSATITYTPSFNFTGNDLFTFVANNGTVDSNTGTVTILVNDTTAVNTPPVANDDSTNTNEDIPVLIPVLANDTDVDGDNLLIESVSSQPFNGSTVINPNATISYSSSANFFGADGFNYTISDGRGGNATAHVSVTVSSVNDPPITAIDIATTPQDKPVVISVLANDTDPERDLLTISAITAAPSNGTAIINSNGTITFSPATGFSGSDTFDYQVSDGNGGNSTGSVLVNVIAAANEPPVVTILNPSNGSQFSESDPVEFSGSANDPEDGNISSLITWESSINGPLGIGPKIVTSSLSTGTHSIAASAIDSGELSNRSTIEIVINDLNEPPIAVADHFKTNEDTPFNLNVVANDTDPENDVLSIAAISPGPNNGHASINSNNTINYIPNQNFNGQDSFAYTISDGNGGNSSAQVIVDVLPVNDNPIARNDSSATGKNTAALIDVLANDTDVDNDPLSITQVTTPAHGTTNIDSGKVKYTPKLNFVGSDEFEYTTSDGNGGNSQASVTVNVKSVNQLPFATDGSVNTDENTPLNVKLNASDPDNDPLTYVLDTQPAHGSIGGFIGNNGTLTYTPQNNFTGQDSLSFKVNDGTADSNIATVLINVKNVNHSPVAENQNVATNTNKQLEITLKGRDPDADVIKFVKVTDPSHGTITGLGTGTGKLTYIPNNGFSGPDSFLFKVVDSNGAESNIATVSITVNAVIPNKPPVASNVNVETNQDTPKVITLLATDPDTGDKIAYVIVSPSSSGSLSSIDPTTGKVTYAPSKGFLGLDSFTYKVTDLSGASSNIATVGITVKSTTTTPYPLPPTCSPNDKSGGKALKGSNSDDVIVGTEAADSIEGLSGNDAINGCGSADTLNGNNGNDGIAGGTSGDNIHGNNGDDYLRGDAGDDGLYGGEGDDVFVGGPGRDSFYCGSGNDKVLDFNANEGDRLQKDQTTRDRDPNKKHDCENVSSVSSTSASAKSSTQELLSTLTGQEPSSDSGNQTKLKASQIRQLQPPTQMGQNETIKVTPNTPPVVNDFTINLDKNNRVSITLHGIDPDGDKLIFKIIEKSQNGLIRSFRMSGSMTYTPMKDYVGDDKFTFVASDGKSTSNVGIVTIHMNDKLVPSDQKQSELQHSEKRVNPFPLKYWLGNIEKTDKLLPLTIGNLTVDSAEKVNSILRVTPDNHNIYDNTGAQILIAKLNIKNEVDSCGKVKEALNYGDEVLNSVNYKGIGSVQGDLSISVLKNMAKAHITLIQFNTQGCSLTVPTEFSMLPNIFNIVFMNQLSLFIN